MIFGMAAENRPVWLSSGISIEWTHSSLVTHGNERRVEIFVVLLRTASIKFVGRPAVDGEEVCAGIVGPQWSMNSLRAEWGQSRDALGPVVVAIELGRNMFFS